MKWGKQTTKKNHTKKLVTNHYTILLPVWTSSMLKPNFEFVAMAEICNKSSLEYKLEHSLTSISYPNAVSLYKSKPSAWWEPKMEQLK